MKELAMHPWGLNLQEFAKREELRSTHFSTLTSINLGCLLYKRKSRGFNVKWSFIEVSNSKWKFYTISKKLFKRFSTLYTSLKDNYENIKNFLSHYGQGSKELQSFLTHSLQSQIWIFIQKTLPGPQGCSRVQR